MKKLSTPHLWPTTLWMAAALMAVQPAMAQSDTPNETGDAQHVAEYTLEDGTRYDSPTAIEVDQFTYTRTFKSAAWQTVYVPFAIPTAGLPDGYEVATINNFYEYDAADGSHGVLLEVMLITDGSTIPALTPYPLYTSFISLNISYLSANLSSPTLKVI